MGRDLTRAWAPAQTPRQEGAEDAEEIEEVLRGGMVFVTAGEGGGTGTGTVVRIAGTQALTIVC